MVQGRLWMGRASESGSEELERKRARFMSQEWQARKEKGTKLTFEYWEKMKGEVSQD